MRVTLYRGEEKEKAAERREERRKKRRKGRGKRFGRVKSLGKYRANLHGARVKRLISTWACVNFTARASSLPPRARSQYSIIQLLFSSSGKPISQVRRRRLGTYLTSARAKFANDPKVRDLRLRTPRCFPISLPPPPLSPLPPYVRFYRFRRFPPPCCCIPARH